MNLSAALLLAVLVAVLPALAAPPPTPPPEEGEEAEPFGEVVSVSLLAFRARILDASGKPMADLSPADLTVRAAGKAIPVLAVDFVDQAVDPGSAADARPGLAEQGVRIHQASSKGQLFVLFVETDLAAVEEDRKPRPDPRAYRGRMPLPLKRLFAALEPDDRVAVVSHGGGLALALDFSRDREAAWQAVERAVRGQGPAPPTPALSTPAGPLSLAAEMGAEMEIAGSPEALSQIAQVLAGLPGEKVLVYVAVGDGSFTDWPGPIRPPEIEGLLDALTEAHASVFVVARPGALSRVAMDALEIVSDSTGGLYLACTDKDVDRLALAVDGYHVVSLDGDEALKAEDGTRITVELAGRKGTILMGPLFVLKGYEW